MRPSFTMKLLAASAIGMVLVYVFYFRSTSLQYGFSVPFTHVPLSVVSPKAYSSQDKAQQQNSTADAAILAFWKDWAGRIKEATPDTSPVQIERAAQNVPAPKDPLALREKPNSRVRLSSDDLESLRLAHKQFASRLTDTNLEDTARQLFNGTGIVSVAGGEYFGPILVGIHMLRQTNSTLPVEIFLANWSEYEPEICERILPSLNARCVVLEDYIRTSASADLSITHYQLKSLAILLSSFQNILYLDSDCIPLVRPETSLFPSAPFTTHGMVGWPDFWLGTEDPRFWTIVGLPADAYPSTLPASTNESGELLVDKLRHLDTLLLAAYYNVHGPNHYYPLLSQGALGQGDKETFFSAAFALHKPFYRVRVPVKGVGRRVNGIYRGSAMVQWLPSDDLRRFSRPEGEAQGLGDRQADAPYGEMLEGVRPAFIHANTPKMNAGHLVDEGDLEPVPGEGPIRLWGDEAAQRTVFAEDLERRVWEVLVRVGCQLEGVVREWKGRRNLCQRLRQHWNGVFGGPPGETGKEKE